MTVFTGRVIHVLGIFTLSVFFVVSVLPDALVARSGDNVLRILSSSMVMVSSVLETIPNSPIAFNSSLKEVSW